jgi:hypothetical protein
MGLPAYGSFSTLCSAAASVHGIVPRDARNGAKNGRVLDWQEGEIGRYNQLDRHLYLNRLRHGLDHSLPTPAWFGLPWYPPGVFHGRPQAPTRCLRLTGLSLVRLPCRTF